MRLLLLRAVRIEHFRQYRYVLPAVFFRPANEPSQLRNVTHPSFNFLRRVLSILLALAAHNENQARAMSSGRIIVLSVNVTRTRVRLRSFGTSTARGPERIFLLCFLQQALNLLSSHRRRRQTNAPRCPGHGRAPIQLAKDTGNFEKYKNKKEPTNPKRNTIEKLHMSK